MTVSVNGQPRDVPAGTTLRDLLALAGRDPDVPGVAAAVDDRVVRRALWAETALTDGARVEVVTAAQGG